MRRRHPKKDVEAALRYAEGQGWLIAPTTSGHRCGVARLRFGLLGIDLVHAEEPREPR